uniref:Kinesin motor domain-containing protein n=1 Tax=Parascaris equorum TaxID=6256 RepID=A0A914R3Z9_PAREQ
GRIRLCVRIRPLLSGESRSVPPYINICGSNTVEIQHVSAFINMSFAVSVFMRMRRGSADEDCAGIIPRSFDVLFRSIGDLSSLGWQVSRKMVLQYFTMKLKMLHKPSPRVDANTSLKSFLIAYTIARWIDHAQNAMKWIYHSDMQRSWAMTKSSKISSRGHTIVRIKISSNVLRSRKHCRYLKLFRWLFVNCSTSTLCIVSHVPYMSDPLTKALAESLGAGSSRTMFIAHIRPNSEAAFESRRTIEFSNQGQR